MKLSPKQREELRMRYGGHCAYCGTVLGRNWHADHIESIGRQGRWVRGKWQATGAVDHPERDTITNLAPACHLCNINKGALPLEQWRKWLARAPERLERNYSSYRHALRLGIIKVDPGPVVFFFERYRPRIRLAL